MASWSLGTKRFLEEEEWLTLKMLFPFFFEYKYRFIFAIACVGIIQLINVATPWLLGSIVDSLDISLHQALAIPLLLLGSYVFIRFLVVAVRELQMAVFGMVTVRATKNLSLKLLSHLHGLDLEYHLSRKTGGLTRDMDRGINAITGLIQLFSLQMLGMAMGFFFVIGIFLAWFDWRYALIVSVCVVIYAVYTVKITQWRTPIIRASNDAHSRAHTRAVDSLINHENVKYFGNEQLEQDLYYDELNIWERARARNRYSLAALNVGQSFVVHLGLLGMLLIACNAIVSGDLSLGKLVALNGYAIQVFGPLNSLGSMYRRLKQAFTDVENMLTMLLRQPRVSSVPNALPLPSGEGPIEFKDVHFSYRPDRPILRGITFTVHPNERVALVGPSGAGKSTIARLLFRFYDTDAGEIRVNGSNIKHVDLDSLRSAFGVVPQDTTLFNDTLEQNIRYGRADATPEEIAKVVRMAHLNNLIDQLPMGLDTVVGERGLKLSGGEKQRVAIARTMLKNPSFLLFDEATSSLDTATESSVMHAIDEVSVGRTSLIIAHRLCTVIDADRIVVLENGRVAETGSHEQLLDLGGIYFRLWKLQHKEITHEEALRKFSVT